MGGVIGPVRLQDKIWLICRSLAVSSKAQRRTFRKRFWPIYVSLLMLPQADQVAIFQESPYLLPTLMGSTILFLGAFLSCFLSWDGGVRGGSRITLTMEKDEPLLTSSERRDASPVPSERTAGPSLRHKRSILLSPGDPETAAGGAGYPTLAANIAGARRESRATLGTAYG